VSIACTGALQFRLAGGALVRDPMPPTATRAASAGAQPRATAAVPLHMAVRQAGGLGRARAGHHSL